MNLFHALVVFGAGITSASCGGRSGRSLEPSPGGGGNNEGGMSGGGAGGQSGAGAVSQGGAGSGGQSDAGIGGLVISAGSGGSTLAPPPPGPQTQWDCSGSLMGCKDGSRGPWLIGVETCPLDPTRPTSADDCDEEELFTCYVASTADGDPILVNCSCELDPGFCAMCLPPWSALEHEAVCENGARACGCAVTGILIAK